MHCDCEWIHPVLFFFNHASEEHRREWFRENYFKRRMTIFLLSLRSTLECVISGKFMKSWECVTFLLSLRSAWFGGNSWSFGSALGVQYFLVVHWKCVVHFCYDGGSALGEREGALECVTNDRSAWKVRTPTHFCSARGADKDCKPTVLPFHQAWDWSHPPSVKQSYYFPSPPSRQ